MSTYYRSQGDIYRDSGTKWNIAFINGYVKYSNSDNKNLTYNSSLYYRNTTVLPNTIDRIVRQTQSSPRVFRWVITGRECLLELNISLSGGV